VVRGRALRLAGLARNLLAYLLLAVLGLFVLVFSFANYPWVAGGLVLLVLLAIGTAERRRRAVRRKRERRRRRQSPAPDEYGTG
jgi:uncharacterized membrane protein YqjE